MPKARHMPRAKPSPNSLLCLRLLLVQQASTKKEVTSAKEAAQLYGYGSPIHQMMRILRPLSGDGVGGIPTVVFPQISSESATETVREWTVTGTATANATHKVIVNGRDGLDFQFYDFGFLRFGICYVDFLSFSDNVFLLLIVTFLDF